MRTSARGPSAALGRALDVKVCQVCGQALSRHEGFAGKICSHWRCRRTWLEDQLQQYRRLAAQSLGVDAYETYPPVVVPWRRGSPTPLPAGRKRAFHERLARLVEAADGRREHQPAPGRVLPLPERPPDPAPHAAVLSRVCAVCEGVCCYHGKELALLDPATVGRLLSTHPLPSRESAVAVYLQHVPQESYRGSCVYHTASGCVLPRPLRAPLCTGYECRGRKDLREHLQSTGCCRGFVVVRQDERLVRGAFVDEGGVRHFPHRGDG
jgi:hypothetical protein